MHVAILFHQLDEPRGAERSQLTLATELRDRGHRVSILAEKGDPPPSERRLRYHSLGLERELFKGVRSRFDELLWKVQIVRRGLPKLRRISPDVIFAQHHTTFLAGCYAAWQDLPFVAFYHWNQQLTPKRPQRICVRSALRFSRESIDKTLLYTGYNLADICIVTSRFARRQWGDSIPAQVAVVYPFIPDPNVGPQFGGEYILHVTPNRQKGIDVTLKMAETMDEQFVIVGSDPEPEFERRMKSLENVTYEHYVHDMAPVYRNARAVVMPSSEAEAAGMVPVEAGLYGTPAVVSGRGGLAEMAPDPFIVDSLDPAAYVDRLQQLSENYDGYCQIAVEYAASRTADRQFVRLRRELENKCIISL